MSSDLPTSEASSGPFSPPAGARKPQRVLSCILCQQRKIKCDRQFPCANCVKSGVSCASAAFPRQRRRRFAERELLDRLRHYESLLRTHNIPFESLHGPDLNTNPKSEKSLQNSPDEAQLAVRQAEPSHSSQYITTASSQPAKSFWDAVNRKPQKSSGEDGNENRNDDDDSDSSACLVREAQVKNAWNEISLGNECLLFCSRSANLDLATMHPDQAHIFRLWQIYLDNINPLLKVTHTPTLRARITDAARDVTNISPPLEALMFSIYCVAIFSLNHEMCLAMFGRPRQTLLRKYQLGAREALLDCDFLRSGDRDCLTALHLYLISVKPGTDPRALSALLGAAMRIAQLMGIHDETANAKHSVLEAELRRRLWWSMVLFDARMSELTEWKVGTLLPTWDCKIPLNANDSEIRSDMKSSPVVFGQPSEALFAVVRGVYGNFQRNSSFYLDFVNPVMKAIAKQIPSSGSGSDLDRLAGFERMLKDEYIQKCDLNNSLHFMTVWTARGYIAKSRFMSHLSTHARASDQTDAQRQTGMTYALSVLDCDTKLMRSSSVKGFRWLIYLYFPFPAYIFLIEDLRKRPLGPLANTTWQVMSDNCASRFADIDDKGSVLESGNNPFFKMFARMVLAAWAIRETASGQSGQREVPPSIIQQVKHRLASQEDGSHYATTSGQPARPTAISTLTPKSMLFDNFDSMYDMSGHNLSFQFASTHGSVEFDNSDGVWTTPNWNLILGNGW